MQNVKSRHATRAISTLFLAISAVTATAAQAATVETKGGLTVRSDDGAYELNIGGRIHLDANLVSEDNSAAFGSALIPSNSSAFFRRARLTFSGKALGWEYNFTPDFAQSAGGNLPTTTTVTGQATTSSSVAFQELYIAHKFGLGKFFIGQFTPFRSIEDNTSSNEITIIERAITSSGGVYRGGISRFFLIGLGYQFNPVPNATFGVGAFNLRRDNTPSTEGTALSARATWAPVQSPGRILHLGISASQENPRGAPGSPAGNVSTLFSYAGLRGPTASLGGTTGNENARYYAGELAGVFGPLYLQSEYVHARYGQDENSALRHTNTDLYHVTLSYNVFGEAKTYNTVRGSFKSIKPKNSFGAVELVARHEFARNDDAAAATAIREVTSDTVGFNYYFNPNTRLLVNYILGRAERVNGQVDKPNTLALRFQLNW